MHRQQAVGLLGQPPLGLLVLAAGTMPVAARTSHPVPVTAAATAVDQVSQQSTSASPDRVTDFALLKRNTLAKLLQIRRAMLPQTIGNRRHAHPTYRRGRWKICSMTVRESFSANSVKCK